MKFTKRLCEILKSNSKKFQDKYMGFMIWNPLTFCQFNDQYAKMWEMRNAKTYHKKHGKTRWNYFSDFMSIFGHFRWVYSLLNGILYIRLVRTGTPYMCCARTYFLKMHVNLDGIAKTYCTVAATARSEPNIVSFCTNTQGTLYSLDVFLCLNLCFPTVHLISVSKIFFAPCSHQP